MNELKYDISELREARVQKIFSTPASICLSCRKKGESVMLYLGRGGKSFGYALGNQIPPSTHRIRDKYLELLRKEMKNWKIERVEYFDLNKLVLGFSLKRLDIIKNFYFIWSGNQHYFAYTKKLGESFEILKSWDGKKERVFELPSFESFLDELPNDKRFGDVEVQKLLPRSFESLWGDYLLENRQKFERKKIKRLSRKRDKILSDLHVNEKWQALLKVVEEGRVPLEVTAPAFFLEGVKIRCHGNESQGKIKDLIFKKIKKLKRGYRIQYELLNQLLLEIKQTGEVNSFEEEKSPLNFRRVEKPEWYYQVKRLKKDQRKLDSEVLIFNIENIKGAIGKNARANDYLRSRWASKNDLWFHIDGVKGAHVILKVDAISRISDNSLRAISSLLAVNSGYEGSDIPLVYALVQDIKGKKGSAGNVIIKRPRYLTTKFLKEWEAILSIESQ